MLDLLMLFAVLAGGCGDSVVCGTGTVRRGDTCVALGNDGGADGGGLCDPARCPPLLHATASCAGDACAYTCETGFDDCNDSLEDGCEADLAAPTTCGDCTVACLGGLHEIGRCEAGSCAFDCEPSFSDCDGDAASGCETSLAHAASCGACDRSCDAMTEPICVAGDCRTRPTGRFGFVTDGTGATTVDRVAALPDGGAIVAGTFSGTLRIAGRMLTATEDDYYIARLDPDGLVMWAEHIASEEPRSSAGFLHALVVDADRAYLAGEASRLTRFGSLEIQFATGSRDGFIAAISLTGTWAWARPYGSVATDGVERILDIAVAGAGELVAVGAYRGAGDLGLDPLPAPGGGFALTVAADDGEPIAQRPIAGPPPLRVAADVDGSIYAFGALGEGGVPAPVMAGALMIGPPFGKYLLTLDADLSPLRLRGLGSSMNAVHGIAARPEGGVVVVLGNSMPFDFGTGLTGFASSFGTFVIALTARGEPVWVRTMGDSNRDVSGPAVDTDGNVYVVKQQLRTGVSGVRGFLHAYGPDGVDLYTIDFATATDNVAPSVVSIDPSGRPVVGGLMQDDVQVGPIMLVTPAGASRDQGFAIGIEPL